jgi:hypothetical protein
MHCGSRNLFDENGTILDQSGVAGSEVRYGYSANNGNAVEANLFKNSVFCDICVNNQNVVLSILQSRDEEEEELTTLKEDLEKRYPPVCKDCEPNVQHFLSEQQQKFKPGILLSPKRGDKRVDSKVETQYARRKWLHWWILRVMWVGASILTSSVLAEPFYLYFDIHSFQISTLIQFIGMLGLISLHFFHQDRQHHNIFAYQAQPALWIPIMSLAALLWSVYIHSMTVKQGLAAVLLLRTLHRFYQHYLRPILKKSPVISTLRMQTSPIPTCKTPERKERVVTQDKIQQSIDALSLSQQDRPRKSNSIWSANSVHTVPWHSKQRPLPPVPIPELRLDSNPNTIHWNMFKKPAFGPKVYQTTPPMVQETISTNAPIDIHFRPQRFFPKQVMCTYLRKILVWKICWVISN